MRRLDSSLSSNSRRFIFYKHKRTNTLLIKTWKIRTKFTLKVKSLHSSSLLLTVTCLVWLVSPLQTRGWSEKLSKFSMELSENNQNVWSLEMKYYTHAYEVRSYWIDIWINKTYLTLISLILFSLLCPGKRKVTSDRRNSWKIIIVYNLSNTL